MQTNAFAGDDGATVMPVTRCQHIQMCCGAGPLYSARLLYTKTLMVHCGKRAPQGGESGPVWAPFRRISAALQAASGGPVAICLQLAPGAAGNSGRDRKSV